MVKDKEIQKKFQKIFPKSSKINLPIVDKIDDYFVEKFLRRLSTYLQQKLFVEFGGKILVAVSGGVDSVVLLDALSLLSKTNNYTLAVAHLNHKIRGTEADNDEKFVVSLADSYGWVCFVQRTDIPLIAKELKMNIENLARQIRYDFFLRACQSFGGEYIATAHTLDDQAETILHNMIRGTGIRGLRGIDARRIINQNFTLIRPLLFYQKNEIIEYAKHRNLHWKEDSSNFSEKYFRNKIRIKLIPLLKESFNPQIVNVLARTSEIAKDYQKIISHYIDSLYNKCVKRLNFNEIELITPSLRHLEKFVLMELLQEILHRNFDLILSYGKLEFIVDLINAESGKGFSLSMDIFVYKDRDKLFFVRKKHSEIHTVSSKKVGKVFLSGYLIELSEVPKDRFAETTKGEIEFLDFDKVPNQVTFRFWMEGDRFTPLGMKKQMKLSDFFINLKVPLHKKQEIPLMVGNDEIIWVCGFRISEKFKITRRTKRVLQAKITKLDYLGDQDVS